MTSPIRPTNEEARGLARDLIHSARFGALAVLDPETAAPLISRIAVVPGPDGLPLALVSDLAGHTQALKANPICSLMVGEPQDRGDPLTHPRLSIEGRAMFIRHGDPRHAELAAHYLQLQPKAKLYIGFADFALMRIVPTSAFLNGGFGKAFRLTPEDLGTT
ncbi:HugZ family protein [Primorskyibacter sp. 2E107]|uniref:HugZ family pyridoxamine 5'-phosphate oxidase n=1 Tax=Primorskyibacter sp. 2E107 TaxID=3403458 RepID=UPI003AF6C325